MRNASEAYDAAVRIWGRARVSSVVYFEHDRTADVNLLPAGGASDTRGRNYVAHRLDGDGRPTCHDDCKGLEARDA